MPVEWTPEVEQRVHAVEYPEDPVVAVAIDGAGVAVYDAIEAATGVRTSHEFLPLRFIVGAVLAHLADEARVTRTEVEDLVQASYEQTLDRVLVFADVLDEQVPGLRAKAMAGDELAVMLGQQGQADGLAMSAKMLRGFIEKMREHQPLLRTSPDQTSTSL